MAPRAPSLLPRDNVKVYPVRLGVQELCTPACPLRHLGVVVLQRLPPGIVDVLMLDWVVGEPRLVAKGCQAVLLPVRVAEEAGWGAGAPS